MVIKLLVNTELSAKNRQQLKSGGDNGIALVIPLITRHVVLCIRRITCIRDDTLLPSIRPQPMIQLLIFKLVVVI